MKLLVVISILATLALQGSSIIHNSQTSTAVAVKAHRKADYRKVLDYYKDDDRCFYFDGKCPIIHGVTYEDGRHAGLLDLDDMDDAAKECCKKCKEKKEDDCDGFSVLPKRKGKFQCVHYPDGFGDEIECKDCVSSLC